MGGFPKIENWPRVTLGVAVLITMAHAHLLMKTMPVRNCEKLKMALEDVSVRRIDVRERISLGDCEWPEKGIPVRDVVITGHPAAALECASEKFHKWKLDQGMRMSISSIALIDSSAVAPTRLLDSCFLRSAQPVQISLNEVVLVFPQIDNIMNLPSFLGIHNQQDSNGFCTLENNNIFIEQMKLQQNSVRVQVRQSFIYHSIHPLPYHSKSVHSCPEASSISPVLMLALAFFGGLAFVITTGSIAWVAVTKCKEPGKHLTRSSSAAEESGLADEECHSLPLEELSLGHVIGKGCFSSVYRGTYKGSAVAVKVFEHDDQSQMNNSKPLEAYLSCSTSHPNVVKSIAHETQKWNDAMNILECIEADNCCSPFSSSSSDAFDYVEERRKPPGENWFRTWLVMEYCNRGSLFSAIRAGKFRDSISEGWKIHDIVLTALDVASALEHLHSKGIIHGDLKSQNVLLSTQDNDPRGFQCKVGDFGFSRLTWNATHINTYTCGAVRAMPPEVLKDGVLTLAADVYSFGILLWEVLSGTMPYKGWSHQMILHNVVEGRRPDIHHTWPKALKRLIEDCLQHKYLDRPNFSMITRRLSLMKSSPALPYGDVRRSFETRGPGFDEKVPCFNLRLRVSDVNHYYDHEGVESPVPCHLEELPCQLSRASSSRITDGKV